MITRPDNHSLCQPNTGSRDMAGNWRCWLKLGYEVEHPSLSCLSRVKVCPHTGRLSCPHQGLIRRVHTPQAAAFSVLPGLHDQVRGTGGGDAQRRTCQGLSSALAC